LSSLFDGFGITNIVPQSRVGIFFEESTRGIQGPNEFNNTCGDVLLFQFLGRLGEVLFFVSHDNIAELHIAFMSIYASSSSTQDIVFVGLGNGTDASGWHMYCRPRLSCRFLAHVKE
jgi:hypothetical protein